MTRKRFSVYDCHSGYMSIMPKAEKSVRADRHMAKVLYTITAEENWLAKQHAVSSVNPIIMIQKGAVSAIAGELD